MHFNYSDIQKYSSLVETWNETIGEDVNEVTWIKKYLHDLTESGGTLSMFKTIAGASEKLTPQDIEDIEIEKKATSAMELTVTKGFENTANYVAKSAGFN